MNGKQLLVLGGGFAGLWSAVGAARKLDEAGLSPETVQVTLVNRDAFHSIRVRNYESDLTPIRIPLDDILGPIGIRRIEAEVVSIEPTEQRVTVKSSGGKQSLSYDRLVYALGSQLVRPPIPGLAEYAFDVDTYNGAARLDRHLKSLPKRPDSPGCFTVIIVGAGLTGIEAACEMPARLKSIIEHSGLLQSPRVILADRNPHIGSDMGEFARPVIETAVDSLGIEMRVGIGVASVSPAGVTLTSGEEIPAATVVWCAGMRANPLATMFPVEADRMGRLSVDEFLRVERVPHVFAAGDVARAMMDCEHASVMSCQHGRPMGRFAGHNVVCDLLNLPMLPLHIDWYSTVLDLGPWGAVHTQGWDRRVVATGPAAKRTKQEINGRRIYPPLTHNREEILAAAAPVIQRPPAIVEPQAT